MRRRALLTAAAIGLIACSGQPAGGPSSSPPDSTSASTQPPANTTSVAVSRVIDGDSLLVISDDLEYELRLFGVNAPESDECGGEDARRRLEQLAIDSVDLLEVDRDQYGRVVGLAWTSTGTQLNNQMVRSGLAVTVTGATDDAPEDQLQLLVEAQDLAMSERLGLWADTACDATRPRPDVSVAITSPNPPGPDDEVLDEEFATVTNTGDTELDLGGWILRDESTANRFRFPPGTTLAPRGELDVISGCNPQAGQIAWCSERSLWNNGGDSAFLLDDFGRIVATDRYRP